MTESDVRRFTPKIVGGTDYDRPRARGESRRLRRERDKIWRKAEAATRYWRVQLDLHDAISCAQRNRTAEGYHHPEARPKDRWFLLKEYRAAIVEQLLTPAPDAASVSWKRTFLVRGDHIYTEIKSERIERAIADDLAFLAAHPVRQSNRKRAG